MLPPGVRVQANTCAPPPPLSLPWAAARQLAARTLVGARDTCSAKSPQGSPQAHTSPVSVSATLFMPPAATCSSSTSSRRALCGAAMPAGAEHMVGAAVDRAPCTWFGAARARARPPGRPAGVACTPAAAARRARWGTRRPGRTDCTPCRPKRTSGPSRTAPGSASRPGPPAGAPAQVPGTVGGCPASAGACALGLAGQPRRRRRQRRRGCCAWQQASGARKVRGHARNLRREQLTPVPRRPPPEEPHLHDPDALQRLHPARLALQCAVAVAQSAPVIPSPGPKPALCVNGQRVAAAAHQGGAPKLAPARGDPWPRRGVMGRRVPRGARTLLPQARRGAGGCAARQPCQPCPGFGGGGCDCVCVCVCVCMCV